jgi:hypothetical protein
MGAGGAKQENYQAERWSLRLILRNMFGWQVLVRYFRTQAPSASSHLQA